MTPLHYRTARAELGTYEWRDGHNPIVVQYFSDSGHSWVKDDETAWCAAFVGAMLERSDIPSTKALNARSYLDWGNPVAIEDAQPGDVVVFSRGNPNGWQGHVAFFVEYAGDKIKVLGGNQSNQVTEALYSKSRLLGIRRLNGPKYIPQPPKVTDKVVPAGGAVIGGAVAAGAVGIWAFACKIPFLSTIITSCGG